MRRFDKKRNIREANLRLEQSYLINKGILNEGELGDATHNKNKEEVIKLFQSIGMDFDSDNIGYADVSEPQDGKDDMEMLRFDKGDVSLTVGLANYTNKGFKFIVVLSAGDKKILEPSELDTIEDVKEIVLPLIEKNYEKTKLTSLGVTDEKEYIPSRSEYDQLLNAAIDKKDWAEAKRLSDKYGSIVYPKK